MKLERVRDLLHQKLPQELREKISKRELMIIINSPFQDFHEEAQRDPDLQFRMKYLGAFQPAPVRVKKWLAAMAARFAGGGIKEETFRRCLDIARHLLGRRKKPKRADLKEIELAESLLEEGVSMTPCEYRKARDEIYMSYSKRPRVIKKEIENEASVESETET